jgi:hypothetical protein
MLHTNSSTTLQVEMQHSTTGGIVNTVYEHHINRATTWISSYYVVAKSIGARYLCGALQNFPDNVASFPFFVLTATSWHTVPGSLAISLYSLITV